jgi:YVTN family beta-propeller protein
MRLFIVLFLFAASAWGQANQLLRLEKTIELPNVEGRIDHMSVDVAGGRLFVSALGNNTVEVIDIKAGTRVKTIGGLQEPQGILYVPSTDRLYVANSKDGTVRIFDGNSYAALKTLDYGDDADNLRYDSDHKRIYVGYGSGALAEINEDGNKVGGDETRRSPRILPAGKGQPSNLCESAEVPQNCRY